jgi:acetylornithine/succinyldiaminopimelate/putrescine aminotransferase
MAVYFESFEQNKKVIDALIEAGVFTDWFLFASHCLRIAPPLNIDDEDIRLACKKILHLLDNL